MCLRLCSAPLRLRKVSEVIVGAHLVHRRPLLVRAQASAGAITTRKPTLSLRARLSNQ